jgi:outer membrane protein OmpA-like peptidoglycan-associated protein
MEDVLSRLIPHPSQSNFLYWPNKPFSFPPSLFQEQDHFLEAFVKIFLPICLATVLTTNAWADSICRQPETDDFGSAVVSQTSNSFVIAQDCAESRLVAKKPVSLSAFIGQGVIHPQSTKAANTRKALTVIFDFNLANLDVSASQLMDQVPTGTRVNVTGYTCSIGSENYNDKLSLRRAEVVASYLRSRGVTINTIDGKGECCPVSTTDLSKNRRVLIEEEK